MYGLFYPAFPQQTLHFLPLQLHYLQGLCLIQILGCGREYIPGQVALGIAGAVAGIRSDFEEEFQTPCLVSGFLQQFSGSTVLWICLLYTSRCV